MTLGSFKCCSVVKSSGEVFFDWLWLLLCWYNIVGVIWFVDVPIPSEGVLDWKCGFVCCLVSLLSTTVVKDIPPIFSINTEEFCRCSLVSLVGVIIPGVLCVTVVLEVCTSFYVFREVVELPPVDVSWDYKMSNDVDGRQYVCLLIRRILLKA